MRVQFSGFFTLTRVWEFVIPQNNSFKPRFLQLGFADLLGQVVGVSPVHHRMLRSVLGPFLLGPLMHSDDN